MQSLQDQLLNAGLVDNNQVKKAKADKRKQKKQQKNKNTAADNHSAQLAQQKREQQKQKDKQLNEQRNKEAELKQLANQIAQLAEPNKLPQDKEGDAYNFTDQNKVKTLYLDDAVRGQIINGKAAIIRLASAYEVVPLETARKIEQRDASSIVVLYSDADTEQIDEAYQDYQIPDDLMW